MNSGAGVNSLEALRTWRGQLDVYRTEALDALAAIQLEIHRAESWLDEKARFWVQAARDAEEEVHEALTELRNRRYPDYSGRMPDTTLQERAVRRAKARLEFAQDQQEVVRRWKLRMRQMVLELYEGPSRRLNHFLDADVARGLALLARQIGALQQYLDQAPPSSAGAAEAGSPPAPPQG
ncbi:hypothetical protein [Tuwongella immobilis]|uniref:Uncharacterized protein n=1 Tax=Tuwongella immobilis TaxID=692036 RepID=A0A6C2YHX8_9BACT|nr:hypothetical protein [Tuwongella immobilis]VIP00665.1 Uncharacterized protein OS=Singulisphaera acidiphila (strain ATCC BAA-1392 / DSM 18658 / VKM B-2454 / MOB10) GN=Sinac_4624 PE=4 SV=1 [Tuwongella immobilis]VTR96748.1 Uncharacterized protein OS=Singulisphaera acidiphila (strain ATCC BAA-1392 / DSM 18658 / VKM B-2454 / MOB10) GN=Sinac_4624 PE=4 SV=1 [Tuwongella immobilis]